MKVLVHPCFRKSDFKINIMLLYQSHEEMKVPYKIKVPNDHFKIKGACVCLGGGCGGGGVEIEVVRVPKDHVGCPLLLSLDGFEPVPVHRTLRTCLSHSGARAPGRGLRRTCCADLLALQDTAGTYPDLLRPGAPWDWSGNCVQVSSPRVPGPLDGSRFGSVRPLPNSFFDGSGSDCVWCEVRGTE